MIIKSIYTNTSKPEYKLSKKTQCTQLLQNNNITELSNFCYPPMTCNISFRGAFAPDKSLSDNIVALQNSVNNLLSPVKQDFIVQKKDAIVDCFNQFYCTEYGKMAMVVEPDFKFLFKDFKESDIKNEQFSIRIVDLKNCEFDFAFKDKKNNLQKIKLKNNQFYFLDNPNAPITYSQIINMNLEEKFDEMIPVLIQGLEKVDDIISGVFNNDTKGYSMFLVRGIKKRFCALNDYLDNIEPEKRYILKRSYANFIPYPNKSAFFLKENDRLFSNRYVFVPQREGDDRLYRIVKLDSESNILDAYLIDLKTGVFKNFCKRKIFNQKNISLIPKNDEKMTSEDIKSTSLVSILEKYYILLDKFSHYVSTNSTKSSKTLLEESGANNYLPFNKIKHNFVDRLKYILSDSQNEFNFIGSTGDSYKLTKFVVDGLNIVKVVRATDKGEIAVFLDIDNCRILDMQSCDKYMLDNNGKIAQISHSSDAFKIRSRVLQDFINEAYLQNDFINDNNFSTQLKTLQDSFDKVSNKWFSTYRNKKTEARKLFGDGFISAKGDAGGFRFSITDKDYSIGFKPHQIGKDRFMRLTIYNNNGEIINNFLLDNYSNVVDNYCSQGRYTRDSISRLPDNIVYKTYEQIKADNVDKYMAEYLIELNKFSDFFFDFMGKKEA